MADIPFTVAVIGAVAPIITSAVPIIVNAIRDDRRDRRDRQAQLVEEQRQQDREQRQVMEERQERVEQLLDVARGLRVLIANDYEYHGTEKAVRAWEIRQQAAKVSGQAERAGMRVPGLGEAADALATAANELAASAADAASIKLGASTRKPDFTELDRSIKDFKAAARAYLLGQPGPPAIRRDEVGDGDGRSALDGAPRLNA